ncbi:MAG: tetratricopeptide repeat protein, partial [Bdellovibrionota bacterium]
YSASEKQFKEALKDLSYGKIPQLRYNLGLLYAAQGKALLSQQYFRLAVQEDENFCPAWVKLAEIQVNQGKLEEAAGSYKKSVSGLCFNNPRAHYELGNLYLKAKEPALAKSKLLELIQFFPSSEWAKKAEITLNMIR